MGKGHWSTFAYVESICEGVDGVRLGGAGRTHCGSSTRRPARNTEMVRRLRNEKWPAALLYVLVVLTGCTGPEPTPDLQGLYQALSIKEWDVYEAIQECSLMDEGSSPGMLDAQARFDNARADLDELEDEASFNLKWFGAHGREGDALGERLQDLLDELDDLERRMENCFGAK